MANIEIDGKKIAASPGMMIIEAADEHNIWIPRFCYHKKLSIAANCRMCLVDVEKSAKPLPACATPITDGMTIWTKSKRAIAAQKSVMEFLLINHPLDCPICDQGGECELQDLSVGYGNDYSRFNEKKRVVADQDLGPLIASDMTRCIQCTRCVRFGSEIAGQRELGAVDRGEELKIRTFLEENITSEVSGNVIELCPVGALTSKPYRFKARAWELTQKPSIAAHDCLGTNIYVHARRDKIFRVVPRQNEEINEVWISDRDRYSYEGLYEERLLFPKIKRNGKFERASWEDALKVVVHSLQSIKEKHGAENIGVLLSPNATTEEAYLLQKWIRGLGSPHIDHRLRQLDFQAEDSFPTFPNMGTSLAALEKSPCVLLVGSLPRFEQPLLNLKLRKVTQSGGRVVVVNPMDCEFNFEVAQKRIVPNGDLFQGLLGIAKALVKEMKDPLPSSFGMDGMGGILAWVEKMPEEKEEDRIFAKALLNTNTTNTANTNFTNNKTNNGEKPIILLGALALNHPEASRILKLAHFIKTLIHGKMGVLTDGANAAGAFFAGAIPYRGPKGQALSSRGFNAREMWQKKLKAYVLYNMEPLLDCAEPQKVKEALSQAECVVMITPFENSLLTRVRGTEMADVLLPSTPFTETSGTFINACGKSQTFHAVSPPYHHARPAWKIFRVLGNLCGLKDFEYQSTEEVLSELFQKQQKQEKPEKQESDCVLECGEWSFNDEKIKNKDVKENDIKDPQPTLIRIAPVPLYSTDNLVRRASPLQQTALRGRFEIRMNAKTAKILNVAENKSVCIETEQGSIELPLVLDPNVAEGTAIIPAGINGVEDLPPPYSPLKVKKTQGEIF